MSIGNLLFGLHGRVNRAKYWLATVIWLAIYLVFGVGGLLAVSALENSSAILWLVGFAVAGVAIAVALFSNVAVGVKRLHYRDKSGWWLAGFYLLPAAVEVVISLLGIQSLEIITRSAGNLVGIWAFVELGCLRGTKGPNRFGPDPLDPKAVAEVFG